MVYCRLAANINSGQSFPKKKKKKRKKSGQSTSQASPLVREIPYVIGDDRDLMYDAASRDL